MGIIEVLQIPINVDVKCATCGADVVTAYDNKVPQCYNCITKVDDYEP